MYINMYQQTEERLKFADERSFSVCMALQFHEPNKFGRNSKKS